MFDNLIEKFLKEDEVLFFKNKHQFVDKLISFKTFNQFTFENNILKLDSLIKNKDKIEDENYFTRSVIFYSMLLIHKRRGKVVKSVKMKEETFMMSFNYVSWIITNEYD